MSIALPGFLRKSLIVVVVLAIGIGLGGLVAKKIRDHKVRMQELESVARQRAQGDLILDKMKSIRVGDTLKDFTFENLEGQPVRLSEHVFGPTWVAVIEPTCETCVNNILRIRSLLPNSLAAHRFVFITGFDIRDMQDLRDSVKIGSLFLFDHRRNWSNGYKFNAFPFLMLVDETLRINDIVIGKLSDDQIKRVL